MKAKWSGYINEQKYSECELISCLNARYYFTGNEFETKAIYDNLMQVPKYTNKNGISAKVIDYWYDLLWLVRTKSKNFTNKYPIETGIMWKRKYHSCLIIDNDKKNKLFRVTNIHGLANKKGWINHKLFFKNQSGIYNIIMEKE